MPYLNIAIDGPAGAGKSTIAKAIARELGILYLDTGAMYRALALGALRAGIDPNDVARVLPLLETTDIFARCIDGVQHTYLNGEDVSDLIRTPEISKGASDISVFPAVRIKLADTQRKVAQGNDVVMDGREIGTYVIPQTPNKFYVTASVEERARRRLAELRARGQYQDVTLEAMQSEITARDHTDSTREFAPLMQAPDAILIDTTDMDIPTAVQAVLAQLKR
ncbi:MAG: (d)CMP kinase [Clostridia bacterium]|nr:(d)CMP kinase [Clostridia bacterium]